MMGRAQSTPSRWPPSGSTRPHRQRFTVLPAATTPPATMGVRRVMPGIARTKVKPQRQAKPRTSEGPASHPARGPTARPSHTGPRAAQLGNL